MNQEKGKLRVCLLSVCFFLLSSSVAHASDVSLFAGWADVNGTTAQAGALEFNNFNVFGVRHEKDFFVMFGFENTFAFLPGSVLATSGENGNGVYYASNLVINLPIGRVLPFVTGGLGFLHKLGDSFPDVGTNFTTNWGGGVKLRRLAGPVGVRVEYRRFTIHGVLDENVNTNEVSVGIMFTY